MDSQSNDSKTQINLEQAEIPSQYQVQSQTQSQPKSQIPSQTQFQSLVKSQSDSGFDALDRVLVQFETGIHQSRINFDSLRTIVTAVRGQIIELEKSLKLASERERELFQRLKDAQTEVHKATARFDSKRAAEEQQLKQMKAIQKYEHLLRLYKQQETQIQGMTKDLEQTRSEAQKSIFEQKKYKAETDSTIQEMTTKIQKYNIEMNRLKSLAEARNAHIQELRTVLNQTIQKERDLSVQWKSLTVEKENREAEYKKQIQTALYQLQQEKSQKSAAQNRVEELEAVLKKYENMKLDSDDIKARLEESLTRCTRLESLLSNQNQELEQVRRLNDSLKRRSADQQKPNVPSKPASNSISSNISQSINEYVDNRLNIDFERQNTELQENHLRNIPKIDL